MVTDMSIEKERLVKKVSDFISSQTDDPERNEWIDTFISACDEYLETCRDLNPTEVKYIASEINGNLMENTDLTMDMVSGIIDSAIEDIDAGNMEIKYL
jgi:hypothetical protein